MSYQILNNRVKLQIKKVYKAIGRENNNMWKYSNEECAYSEEMVNMVADLEEYYEAAGFSDFHERILKNMDDEQIKAYHEDTFNDFEW